MQKLSFEKQVAIVTGAGRGLGAAYATELARRGASVIVNDVGKDEGASVYRAEKLVAEIEAAGGRAVASLDDISSPEGGRALIDQALQAFGRLDVLINNAGFLRPGEFHKLSMDDIQQVVGIHLLGAFNVTMPAWKVMQAAGYGRIVMTASSSTFGHHANSNYAAAKAGVLGLAQSLALEGAEYGIHVNTVLPIAVSAISTDTPLVGSHHARLAAALAGLQGRRPPQSVAHLVVYLASRECKETGCAYSAAAGRYARVFLGLSHGWYAQDVDAVTAEDIAQHMDEINDVSHFTIPTMLAEEIETVVARIKAGK